MSSGDSSVNTVDVGTANNSSWWENENTGNQIKHSGQTLGEDKPAEMNQSAWDYLKQGENNP